MRAALFAAVFLASRVLAAQGPDDFDVDAAAREQLVTDIVRALEQNFVSPARLRQQLPVLIGRWSSGELASLTRAGELVRAINADFDDTLHDGHLMLLPPFASNSPMTMDPEKASAADLARLDADEAVVHYGVTGVSVLDGNIGYIELQHFPYAKLAGVTPAITAAMTRVRDTRALILDLRWNGGGDGDTVAQWMAYFVERPTLLLREWDRRSGKRTQSWTAATVPGPRYGTRRPIWVLTSHGTISGGESMAYALQSLGRARLVGETTAGAAHHNALVRVGGRLVLSVPIGTVEDPRTHTSWEGVGVKPDVAVAADRAYDVALAAARAR